MAQNIFAHNKESLAPVPVLVSTLHDRCGQTQLLPHWPWLCGSNDKQLVFCRCWGREGGAMDRTFHMLYTIKQTPVECYHACSTGCLGPGTDKLERLLISFEFGFMCMPPKLPTMPAAHHGRVQWATKHVVCAAGGEQESPPVTTELSTLDDSHQSSQAPPQRAEAAVLEVSSNNTNSTTHSPLTDSMSSQLLVIHRRYSLPTPFAIFLSSRHPIHLGG